MKKKIVYISGADVFDVKDVRAAFDEVREMLHLDSDTILFGVPVDEESAMAKPSESTTESVETSGGAIETDSDVDFDMEYNQDPESDVEDVQLCEEEAVVEEPVVANSNEIAEDITEEVAEEAPIVPIQSILTSETKKPKSTRKKKTVAKETAKEEVAEEQVVTEPEVAIETTPEVTENLEVSQVEITETDEADAEPEVATVEDSNIEDMISDDMPSEPAEKTLEELLESMAPLREDAHQDDAPIAESQTVEEIDATLESLASEFADTQTNIPTGKKGTGRSRIGKLKNILPLPFSNKKKDDTGLMGDLFGWAGIAANDDDFTIPGFFTNAAGKK